MTPTEDTAERATTLTSRLVTRTRLRRIARLVRRRGRRASRVLGRRWRRSMQLRVVATTMFVSVAVVALLGFFLTQQIESGLLRTKENAALFQAQSGLRAAQSQLDASDTDDTQARAALLDQLAGSLANRSGEAGFFEVVILSGPSSVQRPSAVLGRFTGSISARKSIPDRLIQAVRGTGTTTQWYTYTRMYYEDGTTVPGLAVGAPLGQYELYYLFPLTDEVQTLALVRRTLAAGGGALVLLLAAIAYLVTRQVVTPVRAAAQTAERLAGGDLAQRMRVRGEDDLARLANSFNEMAVNLQQQIQQLEELSRVQRRFVSDVSHELRTPLSTIRVAADVVYEAKEDLDPMVARSAQLLQSQLDRFEELLTDLLEISRYDAGAAVLDSESLDLRELVLHAVGDTEALAERKGTRVVQRLPNEPCVAEVDRRRVERILRNLLVNAIEHGEGNDVIVTVAFDRDAVAVAVRDHGVGMDPGSASLVFDRFWRADPARARTTGGSGLGLSISKEDAELHGGWLQAWGERGMGSQFRLSLPRVAGEELRGSPLPLVPVDLPAARGRSSFSARSGSTSTVSAHG